MPLEEQTYREFVKSTLSNIDGKVDKLDVKVTYTNGKVRKIILALVLLAGVVIGQTFTNPHDLISLLFSAL